jgi:hypothetical protein
MENCHDQQARTMPKAFARKVHALNPQHKRVERASWNRICCQAWPDITDVTDPDTELMAAVESSQQRQLAKIDAQLAEFGIEPRAPKTEEQKPNYLHDDFGRRGPEATDSDMILP